MIICPHCQAINDDRKTSCVRCGGSLLDDPGLPGDPYAGRQFGRRFTLQHIVGSGEIGMVYRGLDAKTGQAVAVKIVHGDVAAIHGDELLRWARRVAQIRHAKVATVLGASREPDGTTYVVSEFIEGETLRGLIERVGPLGGRRATDILFQLCNALAPIHKVDRPHANLKPENVYLVAGQQGDFVKISDTGSPVLFGVHHTDRGKVIIGAPKYFSPEQAAGVEVGLASDQFTLGVIGYQLLSGALPFFGATPDQLLEAVQHNRPTPIAERAPATPPALAAVIERCMEKDPAARFPDLRALAREIARIIKSGPQTGPVRPKRTFGAGLDMSTVVARPDEIPDLQQFAPLGPARGFSAADAEATVMQDVPEDIQALLDEQTPAPPGEATPTPFGADLDLDDDFGADLDLDAALAQAAAAVAPAPRPPAPKPPAARVAKPTPPTPPAPEPRRGAPLRNRGTEPRVSAPGGPAFGDDALAAALAEAEAELDAGSGGATPQFDPFGELDLTPAAPKRSTPPGPAKLASNPPARGAGIAARASVSQPLRADDILSAIGEEIGAEPARPSADDGAAPVNPLATAADFTRLSVPPRDAAAITGRTTTSGQVASAGGRKRSKGPLALLLLLLLGGGGAAVWFFVLAPPDQPTTPPKPRAQPVVEKAPTPTPAERRVELVTDPAGAAVFEGDEALGETPLTLALGEQKRALVLKLEGRPDTPYELDPAGVQPAEGDGPARLEVALAAAGDAGVPEDGEGDAAGEPAPTPPKPPKPPKPAGQGEKAGDKPPAPRPKPPRPKIKKPDPGDIRDPFANP